MTVSPMARYYRPHSDQLTDTIDEVRDPRNTDYTPTWRP